MGFCIMRMEKLKSAVSLRRAVEHNARERKPPNADHDLSPNNWVSGGSSDEVMANYQAKLPGKVRANAVHAVEVVMTFGKGFYGDAGAYLADCGRWAEGVFGKENVIHVAHHWDEATPHVHALVMPLKDGKLNAKAFIGGDRDRMAQLQDDFFQKVGRKHGLDRGKPKEETKARHSHHTLAGKITEVDVIKKALEKESYHLGERAKGVESRERFLKKEADRLGSLKDDLARKELGYHNAWERASDITRIAESQVKNNFGKTDSFIIKILQEERMNIELERDKFWAEFYRRLPGAVKQILQDVRRPVAVQRPVAQNDNVKSHGR